MKLILASTKDIAAQNIATQLRELYDFELASKKPETYIRGNIQLTNIPEEATRIVKLPAMADEVIFASRHVSKSRKPALTVHAPGDLQALELGVAAPQTIKVALRALVKARDELNLSYEVSLEATHHGPTNLPQPITFVEIGSSVEQWRDPRATAAVARAVMAAAVSSIKGRNALALGGPHYAPRHTEVVLQTDVQIGHILPKYATLSEELIRNAIARTHGGVELFSLDWKGLEGKQRRMVQAIASKLGLPAAREKDIISQAKV